MNSKGLGIATIFLTIAIVWSTPALAGVSDWIEFKQQGGHITIAVMLNGEPTTAMLDSGASGNGISESFLRRHDGEYRYGRSIVVRGVQGDRRVRLIDDINIGMFGSEFRMGELMPIRVRGFDFLIGLPFFENYIVQIDYPNSRLRLIDHDSLNLNKDANVIMRRARGSSHPVVKVNLNDEYKLWLTLAACRTLR